jgi:hypothetical protein
MQFSEHVSYKILSIPSYGLEDVNFARFSNLQELKKNRNSWAGPDLSTELLPAALGGEEKLARPGPRPICAPYLNKKGVELVSVSRRSNSRPADRSNWNGPVGLHSRTCYREGRA